MARTQLNINIDPGLLTSLKQEAIRSGQTLTQFVSAIISKEISQQATNLPHSNLNEDRLNQLEERVNILQSQLGFLQDRNKQLSEQDAQNISDFIREAFYKISRIKGIEIRSEAFNSLIEHLSCFDTWNDIFTLRLKEVLFMEDGDPLRVSELNDLNKSTQCGFILRTAFINWINTEVNDCSCSDLRFPTEDQICNYGPKVVDQVVI